MKNYLPTIKFLQRLLLLFLCIYSVSANATRSIGGQITYKLLKPAIGQYRITLELYGACEHSFYSSQEPIYITVNGTNVTVNANLKSKEEVTPIAYPPDVPIKPETNCDYYMYSIGGYMKYTYEVDYVIGKNVGWAIVGFQECVKAIKITNIENAGSQCTWIQAAINTNYENNSPAMNSKPVIFVPNSVVGNYSVLAEDVYDPKFIFIAGQPVLRDSIAYEFIDPFTNVAINISAAFALQNPTVTYKAGLDKNKFLYSNSQVIMDQKKALFNFTSSTNQVALFNYVVREYRAIPSGTSYTRELIGYTMRTSVVEAWGTTLPITFKGIIKDSSWVDSLANDYTAMACQLDNKIMFKVIGAPYLDLKVKDLTNIDSRYIENYSVNSYKSKGNNVDTLYVTIKFRRKKFDPNLDFLFNIYYVNSIGYIIDKLIPIKLIPGNGQIQLAKDTTYYCITDPWVRLDAGIAVGTKWRPLTNLVAADPDSVWIDVAPAASQWYYVDNLSSSSTCKIRDSIYVKVISCDTIFGVICLDRDKNCRCDPWDFVIPNSLIRVKGVTNSYDEVIYTDTLGKYWYVAPSLNSYTMESEGKLVTCGVNNRTQKAFTLNLFGNSTVNLHILDSSQVKNSVCYQTDTNFCYKDSVRFDISFYKNFGKMKGILYYGDGLSDTFSLGQKEGFISLIKLHLYSATNSYVPKMVFIDHLAKPFDSFIIQKINVLNCIKGRVFIDHDINCMYELSKKDRLLPYYHLELKNNTTGTSTRLFSNSSGEYILYLNKLHSYELKNKYTILCNNNLTYKILPASTKDTVMNIDIPITNQPINYQVLVGKQGKVASNEIFYLDLKYTGYFTQDTGQKIFQVQLPPNTTYQSISPNASIVSSGISHRITLNTGTQARLGFKFNSLAAGDILDVQVRLYRVLPEIDTSDNFLKFYLAPNTSYGQNHKDVSIASHVNDTDFINHQDYLIYRISFQNNQIGTAYHVLVSDSFDAKLDISTLEILSTSHSCTPVLTKSNNLMVLFRNIALVDSVTSDSASRGYIYFRAKPQPNLALNSTIYNEAKIKLDILPIFSTNLTKSRYIDSSSIGIASNQGKNFSVYPNPFTGKVFINIPQSKINQISLYSLDGRLIDSFENKESIDLSYLNKGIYWVIIRSNKQIITEKIVKE